MMTFNLGGRLRSAVIDGKLSVVEALISQGADVNYNEPDMVNPSGGTPLHMAAIFGNLKMVKKLVDFGADVAITDKRGFRAYHYAAYGIPKNLEIANYLKRLEPAELHSLKVKLAKLQCYRLPDDLLAFLQGDNLCIKLSECDGFYLDEIVFYSLIDTVETEYQGQKLLLISADIDGASCELVWVPESKCLGYIDIEHGDFNTVCSFADLLKTPTEMIYKIAIGEYAK
ncbi:MAG: ankyrin repeat domain-containing protein [Oscillospiraceae bacterium]|nr:ankyrin repeat domain-containing protein [Oscillospiraceae bacterium]